MCTFFDSIQTFQCHCQNIHCVKQITLHSKKKTTSNTLIFFNCKSFHDFFDEKISTKRVNKFVNDFMFEQVNVFVSTEFTKSSTSFVCFNLL